MNRKYWGIAVLALAVPLGLWLSWCSRPPSPRGGSVAADEARPGARAADRPWRDPLRRPASRAEEPRPLQLAGQVIGADGEGVGGAEVSLSGAAARTVLAGEDGTFTFGEVEAGEHVVQARAGDRIGGPVAVRPAAGPVLIRVYPGAQVRVRVVEESGRPIASAEVGLLGEESTIVRTDGAGLAMLRGVRAGRIAVTVSGARYATSETAADATPDRTAELTVTLRRGFTVSGSVVDQGGQPVAGARVSVRGGLGGVGVRGADAVTEAGGRFTVAALGAGTHTLTATDGEHAPADAAPVTITDRPIAGVRIVLKEGGAIDGLVTDADATPARAATVRIIGHGPSFFHELRTDEEGRFQARGLPRSLLQLQAESDGSASDVVDVDLASEAGRPEVALVLEATESIAGVVVDARSRPVAGVQVHAHAEATDDVSPYAVSRAAMATTDRRGEFRIGGVRPGAYRLFATGAPGLRNPDERGVAATAGDGDVRIALIDGGMLRGRLRLRQSGAAPTQAELQLEGRSPVSIVGGAIDIGDIPPGTYGLSIRGAEFAEVARDDLVIRAGQATDLGTVELSAGRTLVGKVVDGRQRPVEGATIRIAGSSSVAGPSTTGGQATTSDRDGAFTLRGLPVAVTSVAARHHERGSSIAREVPGGTADPAPVVLILRGAGSVAGTVSASDLAEASAMVTLMSREDPGPPRVARAGADGSFQFTGVAQGHYTVSAIQTELGSSRTASAAIEVAAGAETKVALDLPRGAIRLSVQLEAPAGGAVAEGIVFLFRGGVAASTEDELMERAAGGMLAGMVPWRADGEPPAFDELVPDSYSVCALARSAAAPAAGATRAADSSRVSCRRVQIGPAPSEQTVSCQLPGGG